MRVQLSVGVSSRVVATVFVRGCGCAAQVAAEQSVSAAGQGAQEGADCRAGAAGGSGSGTHQAHTYQHVMRHADDLACDAWLSAGLLIQAGTQAPCLSA